MTQWEAVNENDRFSLGIAKIYNIKPCTVGVYLRGYPSMSLLWLLLLSYQLRRAAGADDLTRDMP